MPALLAPLLMWGLVAAPPSVVVELAVGPGLDHPTAAALAGELTTAVERAARTARRATLDAEPWTDCAAVEPCAVGRAQARGADELVILHMVGAPSLVRVLAERRLGPTGALVASAELDLPRDPAGWEDGADRLLGALFPDLETPKPEPPPAATFRWGPVLVLGGAAAALVPGIVLGRASEAAREEARSSYQRMPEHEATLDRATTDALAANVCFGAAALLAAGAVVWLLVD